MANEDIDFSKSNFPTVKGFPHLTQQAVMPLVAFREGDVRPLGTCFNISPHGLVLTARHVVDEALQIGHWKGETPYTYDGEWWLGAIYVREPLPGENVDGLFGGLLPARKAYLRDDLDIAVLSLNLPVNQNTGEYLHLPQLRLSPGLPMLGSECFGLGYHSMKSHSRSNPSGLTKYVVEHSQSYSATRGIIEEVHFPKRDSANLHFPCFRTSARFDGGMSGGPVMNGVLDVIGVICSSFGENEGSHISYASLIGPALLIQVEETLATGNSKDVLLYDFVLGGSVVVDATSQTMTVTRAGSVVAATFRAAREVVSAPEKGMCGAESGGSK